MRVIAVVNQKGGVGKTTTSVNLGAGLARRGRRVLLIDMDPQGNLTDHLLGDAPEGTDRPSVYDVIVEGKPVLECLVTTGTPGLSVVPSHEDMAGAELDLASVIGREVLLRDALAELGPDAFDYVFLDCPPSLGLLSLNALAAADEVFIALQTEFFAMRGLSALDRTIDLVRRRINPRLRLGGIVATLVDPTRLSREVTEEVRGHYGDRMFTTKVRTNVRLAEAPSHGKHIFDYAPDSPGAADYAALAQEVEEGRSALEAAEATPADGGAAEPTAPERGPAPVADPVATPAPAAAKRPARGFAAAVAQAVAALDASRSEPVKPAAPARPAAVSPAASATPDAAPAVPGPNASRATPAESTDPARARPAAPDAMPPTHDAAARTAAELAPEAVPGAADVDGDAHASRHEATVATGPALTPRPLAAPIDEPAATPSSRPPPATAPRPFAVPLPVLRGGPRPLSIAPMPTRAPNALPRPASAAGGTRST